MTTLRLNPKEDEQIKTLLTVIFKSAFSNDVHPDTEAYLDKLAAAGAKPIKAEWEKVKD